MVTTTRQTDNGIEFYPQPYSRALECIEQRTSDTLVAALRRIAKEHDPNWLDVHVQFKKLTHESCLQLSINGKMQLDAMPVHAYVNGPKQGDIDIMEAVRRMDIMRLLELYYLQLAYARAGYLADNNIWNQEIRICSSNEHHRITLIPYGVVIGFENVATGVITSVEGERFVVEMFSYDERKEYSLQQLIEEMAIEDSNCAGEACDVRYLPYRGCPTDDDLQKIMLRELK
jgi:hypothetical protein